MLGYFSKYMSGSSADEAGDGLHSGWRPTAAIRIKCC